MPNIWQTKLNHTTTICWDWYNQTFHNDDEGPRAFTTLNLSDNADPNFHVDFRATSHMTNNTRKLDQLIPYKNSDKIFAGNS